MECAVLSQPMIASYYATLFTFSHSSRHVCCGLLNENVGYSIAIVYLGETSSKYDAFFARLKRCMKYIFFRKLFV